MMLEDLLISYATLQKEATQEEIKEMYNQKASELILTYVRSKEDRQKYYLLYQDEINNLNQNLNG